MTDDEAADANRPRFGTNEGVFPKSEAMRLMSPASHVAFLLAQEEASLCGASTVEPAHVFIALAKLCDLDLGADFRRRGFGVPAGPAQDEAARVRDAFRGAGLDPMTFRRELRAVMAYSEDYSPTLSIDQSCPQLLAAAERRRKESRASKIQLVHLLGALTEQTFAPWLGLLKELEVDRAELARRAGAFGEARR